MSYSTQSDIEELLPEDQFIQLTDDAGVGSIDTSVVQRAIDDADSLIDSFLMARYTTPLSPVPALIRKLSVDIAIYNLYSRAPMGASDERKERYDNAVKLLKSLSKGEATLGAASPAPDAGGQPEANKTTNDRIFTKETLGNF